MYSDLRCSNCNYELYSDLDSLVDNINESECPQCNSYSFCADYQGRMHAALVIEAIIASGASLEEIEYYLKNAIQNYEMKYLVKSGQSISAQSVLERIKEYKNGEINRNKLDDYKEFKFMHQSTIGSLRELPNKTHEYSTNSKSEESDKNPAVSSIRSALGKLKKNDDSESDSDSENSLQAGNLLSIDESRSISISGKEVEIRFIGTTHGAGNSSQLATEIEKYDPDLVLAESALGESHEDRMLSHRTQRILEENGILTDKLKGTPSNLSHYTDSRPQIEVNADPLRDTSLAIWEEKNKTLKKTEEDGEEYWRIMVKGRNQKFALEILGLITEYNASKVVVMAGKSHIPGLIKRVAGN